MVPKQGIGPTERGGDPEGCLVVVDCLLYIASRTTYVAEDTVTVTDTKLIAFALEEVDCFECGLFCGVELAVPIQ